MKKYEIGYTTGVFDMLHVGHLNILRRAKEQCNFLIVGVSTDELVKEYKGKLPIIPFSERLEMVAALQCVPYTKNTSSTILREKLNVI